MMPGQGDRSAESVKIANARSAFAPASALAARGARGVACAALAIACGGCASMGQKIRSWVSGDEAKPPRTVGPKFSEQDSVKANTDRRYQRMSKQRFEEEASIGQEAGSLWVMEGQGGYLFSQNQMRMVGDLMNVKIEGAPKAQLQTKAKVIAKLLDRLERPEVRGPASQGAGAQPPGAQGANPAPPGAQGQAAAPGAAGGANAAGAGGAPGAAPGADPNKDAPAVPLTAPTRIVEILKDGSYRVKGSQPFMIGKREYKAIVTGIVRSEDFDEAGVDASKLLDAQFDIVGSKRGATL